MGLFFGLAAARHERRDCQN